GTGTVIPATDTRQPAAPDAPTLSDQRILDAVGVWRSRIGASWLAVTQATNGTALVPVRYELWGQPMTGGAGPWRRLTTATGLSAAWEPFDTGSTWRFAVKAVGPNGKVSELGAYTQWTFGPDTTPPNKPATPTATAYLGAIVIAWGGKDTAGADQPGDFARCEVHVSTVSGFAPIAATLKGEVRPGSTLTLAGLAYGVVHYVRLVSVDFSGNRSVPSDQVAVTPRRAVTDDMANSAIDDIVNASVDAVMPSIAGKNRVTHSPDAPTNYAGQTEGDVWFRYSGTTIIGWWRAASSTVWAPQTLAEAWLPQVNIGTGTYGLLDGVRILADSIAVSKLLVSDWQNLAVDSAFKSEMGVNWTANPYVLRGVATSEPNRLRITSQTPGNTSTQNSLTFDVLPGEEYYLEVEAVRYAAYASVNQVGIWLRVWLNDGSDVYLGVPGTPGGGWAKIYGTVTMPANARSAAVLLVVVDNGTADQHYGFRSPKAYRRNAGNVIIDGSLTSNKMSATDIFTINNYAGSPAAAHTRMTPDGFSAWAPNPDAGGTIQSYARFGDGLAFGFDEGSPDARITGKGHASLASASVGELWVDGSTLDEILNPLPKGMVAWTRGQASITGTTTTETALIELRAVLERNRTYVVKVPTLSARSSVAGDVHEIKARIAYDGAPVGTSSTILSLRRYPALVAGVYTMVPGLDLPLNTNGWGAATREARILLTLVRYTGSGTHDVYADATQPITLSVIDEGTYIEPTTTALLRTSVWNCSAMSKQGSTTAITTATLANTQFAHCLFNGNAAQGETGLTVAAALSGATLVKAEVGAYISWYDYDPSSWAPYLGFSAHTNTTPAASLTIGTTADSEDYDPPEFKWTDITSLFTTASRSVAVTSWGSELLKLLNTAAHPVRLRLTYRR
ncbi:MAG TPA: hypothetical protein PKD84_13395, partial [Propionicimonas sp.]|nr:hypothetical protein [Propionicimonas sp.]